MATQRRSTATLESDLSNIVTVTTYSVSNGGLSGYYYRTYTATYCYVYGYDSSGNPLSTCYNYDNTVYTNNYNPDPVGSGYTTVSNYINVLQARTGASYSDAETVYWYGYIKPDVSAYYQVCSTTDDQSQIYIDGRLVVNDWPASHAPVMNCAGHVYIDATSFHSLQINYANNCRCSSDGAYFDFLVRPESGPRVGQQFSVPPSWQYRDVPFGQTDQAPASKDASALAAAPGIDLAASLAALSAAEQERQHSRAEQIWDSLDQIIADLGPRSASAATPAACDTNVLNPSNYSSAIGCFGQNANASIPIRVPGASSTGSIVISHSDGSIDRTIDP